MWDLSTSKTNIFDTDNISAIKIEKKRFPQIKVDGNRSYINKIILNKYNWCTWYSHNKEDIDYSVRILKCVTLKGYINILGNIISPSLEKIE